MRALAIERRKRGGRTYLYYKFLHESIYLGTPEQPNREGLRKAQKHCLKRKSRVDPDLKFVEQMLSRLESHQPSLHGPKTLGDENAGGSPKR